MIAVTDHIASNLPYLDLSDTAVLDTVNLKVKEVQHLLADQTGLTGADIEDETQYDELQKSLIGYYASYLLLTNKAVSTLAGDAASGAAPATRQVKKAKADVVETEFMQVKSGDGSNISFTAEELREQFIDNLCNIAERLGYDLSVCGCIKIPAFRVIR